MYARVPQRDASRKRKGRTGQRIARTAAGIVTALAVSLIGATVASATPAPAPSSGATPFAAQAQAAGLSAAQARQLQAEVDQELATYGGTQVAANQVLMPNGAGDTLFPLPGEQRARELSPSGTRSVSPNWHITTYGCRFYEICLYRNQNYSGVMQRFRACGRFPTHYFYSYVNNQTPYTSASFFDYHGRFLANSLPAYNRTPVPAWPGAITFYIEPCARSFPPSVTAR